MEYFEELMNLMTGENPYYHTAECKKGENEKRNNRISKRVVKRAAKRLNLEVAPGKDGARAKTLNDRGKETVAPLVKVCPVVQKVSRELSGWE